MRLKIIAMKRTEKFYGWKMVGILWLVYFLMQGLVLYGEPVVNSSMILSTGMGRSILGAGTSIFMLFQGLSGPFVGKGINKFGIKYTIIFGAILVAISSVLMSTVPITPLLFLLSFGLISGIGIGFSGMFSVQSGITYWFREKRALAMSIALTGAGIGGFVAGNVLNKIITVTGDWRMAWHFITVTCIITIIISAVFIVNRPEAIGQIPDGYDYEAEGKKDSKKRFSRVYKTLSDAKVSDVLRDKKFWCIVIALTGLRFTYSICVGHAILHLLDRGIVQAIAATAVGTMTLFSVVGRLGAGAIGDKIEPRTVWLGGMVLFVIGFLFLMYARNSFMAILFSICLGLGFGVSYVCSAAMLGNYYGVNTFPSAMGVTFPFQMIIGAISPVFAGTVYDLMKSYDIAFYVGLLVAIIATVGVALATPPKAAAQSAKSELPSTT